MITFTKRGPVKPTMPDPKGRIAQKHDGHTGKRYDRCNFVGLGKDGEVLEYVGPKVVLRVRLRREKGR